MAEAKKKSLVSIQSLYYGDVITDAGFNISALKSLLITMKEVENVHGDTFQYEETEPTVTSFKNQLTGKVYRNNIEDGEAKITFTIGEYDFMTKAELQGGTATATSWTRGDRTVEINKAIVGKTLDGVYIVFPKASIVGRGANTDGAIGLAVAAVAKDTAVPGLKSEYWFDASEVEK